MKQIVKKNESREITYLFQALEKEWERSGRTVTNRKLNQDAIDMFSEYYVRKVKEYEREQEKDETKSIKKMVKTIKDMSILLRITKKICAKSRLTFPPPLRIMQSNQAKPMSKRSTRFGHLSESCGWWDRGRERFGEWTCEGRANSHRLSSC